jgi:hypothetical protein
MFDLKEIQKHQQEMNEQFETLKKEYQEKSKKLFIEAFKQFFEQVPSIKAVTWQQYTPYFNDGEACEFGVGEKYFLTQKGLEDFMDEGGSYAEEYAAGEQSYYESQYKEGVTPEHFEAMKTFEKFLCSIDDEIYLHMFDDHSYVVATKDGFEVNSFEHD